LSGRAVLVVKPGLRRTTYVFRRGDDGKWLCAIENSYGTGLLDVEA
jgi:ketosteroid isomerase-like protein